MYHSYGTGAEVAFAKDGKPLNRNQIIKLQHDTLEFSNFLKNLSFLGFVQVDVEKVTRQENGEHVVSDEPIDGFQYELDFHLLGEAEAERRQAEKKVKKIDVIIEKEEKEVDELKSVRQEYEKVFGKKGHHTWGIEKLKQLIEDEKNK